MLTTLDQTTVVIRFLRELFKFLDKMIYGLVVSLYNVFVKVSEATILNGEVVKSLIGRMQLIIGVVFIFAFAIHIVQVIVNPDLATDSNKGSSKLIVKVIIALFILAAMLPLNIPHSADTYQEDVANQGLLFGTLSFFQSRVIRSNVLGKLVLGSASTGTADESNETQKENMENAGEYMASSILKMFIFPNMKPGSTTKDVTAESVQTNPENDYICANDPDAQDRFEYYGEEWHAGNIFGYVDNECTIKADDLDVDGITGQWLTGNVTLWQFQYLSPFSTAVGIFMLLILINFTIEIAVRVFKMLILRILGPIAAISYALPSSSDSGGIFNTWSKTLASTYIDIFLRLAIIYFIVFVTGHVLTSFDSSQELDFVTIIFIIVGLFLFAKQAPKFIRDALGMKDTGSSMGGLFGALGGALGLGAAAAGAAGSAYANWKSSRDSAKQNAKKPDSFFNHAKAIGSGIIGAGSGFATGVNASLNAEKGKAKAARDAMNQRNALKLAQGEAGVTEVDKAKANMRRMFGLQDKSAEFQNDIDNLEAHKSSLEAIKDRANGEIVKQSWTTGSLGLKDSAGNDIMANYKHFAAQLNSARDRGIDHVDFYDSSGNLQSVSLGDAIDKENLLRANNESDYIARGRNEIRDSAGNVLFEGDSRLGTLIDDAVAKGGDGTPNGITNRTTINKQIDKIDNSITKTNAALKKQQQIDAFSKNDK